VTFRTFAGGAAFAASLLTAVAGVALARNPHCAGGIQYVVQGMRDKEKGNTEDYQRQMQKAVQQLETCATEDPKDAEAIGYLGWAYAEVDSARLAGKAFQTAIAGLEAAGDKKKVEQWVGNRNSYWANAFNDGIKKIQAAQTAYPDFSKEPASDADKTAKAEAKKQYEAALMSLQRADWIKPADSQTIRTLGSVHAFMGDYAAARKVFSDGLKAAPGDTGLAQAMHSVDINYANQLANSKKYDEAITYFEQILKDDANNPDIYVNLGSTQFERAGTKQGDAQKADFNKSGEYYEKAFSLRPTDADLIFNAALAYQNARNFAKAAECWQKALKLKPDDPAIPGSLSVCLIELGKYDEAVSILQQSLVKKPEDKTLHRALGAAYTKCGNNAKGTEELMVYLAMDKGQAEADPAAAAKAAKDGSAAAKTLASDGTPDQVIRWEADAQKYETWLYKKKNVAYSFQGGQLATKSDWSTAAKCSAAPASGAKK
jgi:tetratricopeptide (TPR) repeat protein